MRCHLLLNVYAPPADFLQEGEEETYYDAMKRELTDRAAKTKAALDVLDPAQRVAMEVCGRGWWWVWAGCW